MVPEDELRRAVKAEIRDRRRRVRRALPVESRRERSEAIASYVTALPEWDAARTVMLFASMATEVQTASLVAAARAAGKRIGAPCMNADRTDLEVREWRADQELEESGMMFMQPPSSAPAIDGSEVDLVVVPALAADERGHRIGFGKGFYDRLLPRLGRAVRVGVLFEFERIAEVPDRPGDERLDVVVTDAGAFRTGR